MERMTGRLQGITPFAFGGIPGDVPVVGDWTGDGVSKGRDVPGWILLGSGFRRSFRHQCDWVGTLDSVPVRRHRRRCANRRQMVRATCIDHSNQRDTAKHSRQHGFPNSTIAIRNRRRWLRGKWMTMQFTAPANAASCGLRRECHHGSDQSSRYGDLRASFRERNRGRPYSVTA